MDILKLSESIAKTYNLETSKPSKFSNTQNYITPNIRPTDIYVYQSFGATLQTNKGELLDMSSMTVNTILGQNDPWVKANLIAYLKTNRPSFLSTRFGSELYYTSAETIAQHAFVDDPIVNHRQCNGSDVTELAILAAYTASTKPNKTLISFFGSYHGQNLTSYFVSDLQRHNLFLVRSHKANITFLTPPHSEADENKILESIYELKDNAFGIILEPLQVNNDIYTFNPQFLEKLKLLCEQENIALIFDEIQTAYGWLGKMTAAEYFNVKPNITALSKGITSGFGPLAAIAANRKYQEIPYGTGEKTNGGDIRSLIASRAVYERLLGIPKEKIPQDIPDQLQKELSTGLLTNVPAKSALIEKYLQKFIREFGNNNIKLTGRILIRGITFAKKENAEKAYQILMDNNVYVRKAASTLIIKPALTITENQLIFGLEKIHQTLKSIFPKKNSSPEKITTINKKQHLHKATTS